MSYKQKKGLNKIISYVNELKTKLETKIIRVRDRIDYLERRDRAFAEEFNKRKLLINALHAENAFLRSFLYKKFPDLKNKYDKFRDDYQGAATLLDLKNVKEKLKL